MSIQVGYSYSPEFAQHNKSGHPENQDRLQSVWKGLSASKILPSLKEIPIIPATVEELSLVHTPTHIEDIRRFSEMGGGMLDGDTYLTSASYKVGTLAAGAGLSCLRSVMDQKTQRSFALVRPPGHHAFADHGEGFCFFNSVAIAARAAIEMYKLDRVMILDWDVHHGNGTNSIFYNDPKVLFVSLHQHPLYPGSGFVHETGGGKAKGTTLNIPVSPGMGDIAYLRLFDEVIEPVVNKFCPQLILVSAGYDAHWREKLSGVRTRVSITGFAKMAARAVKYADQHAQGRVVALLEGGYDTEVLAHSVHATFKVFQNEDHIHDPIGPCQQAEVSADDLVAALKQEHGIS